MLSSFMEYSWAIPTSVLLGDLLNDFQFLLPSSAPESHRLLQPHLLQHLSLTFSSLEARGLFCSLHVAWGDLEGWNPTTVVSE